MTYVNEIEHNITDASALKDSIINVVNDVYTLLQQVQKWLSFLVNKNQLVYPLHSWVNKLLNDARTLKKNTCYRHFWALQPQS